LACPHPRPLSRFDELMGRGGIVEESCLIMLTKSEEV